jgi:acyl carrier protein
MNTLDTVIELISDVFIYPRDSIQASTKLGEIVMDSLEKVELTIILEEEFMIDLSDMEFFDKLQGDTTVQELVDIVEGALGNTAPEHWTERN